MISEVDIRDWEKIDIQKAKEVVDDLDDFARMDKGVEAVGAIKFMQDFFQQLELIRDKQLKAAQSRVPALFRKGEE